MKHHQGLTYNTNSMTCEGKQFNCLVWSGKLIKKMEFEISYQGHGAGAGSSLAAQRSRFCLPMKEKQVRSLGQ